MNNVQISGVLVSRHDDVNKRKVPRTVLEIYNNDVHDVIRAVIYGRRRLDALAPEIIVGANVQVAGRLTNVRWRTPGIGRTIREIGIDVRSITPIREGVAESRTAGQPKSREGAGHTTEIHRLAECRGLDATRPRSCLDGREPEQVPSCETATIRETIVQDLKGTREAQPDPVAAQETIVPAYQGSEPNRGDGNGHGAD